MSKFSAIATLRIADHYAAGRPHADDMATVSARLTSTLTAELDGAQRYLGVSAEELLVAAVTRTIARTIGDGDLAVDVDANGHSAILPCRSARRASATDVLQAVHRALAADLQELPGQSDVFFSYHGAPQEPAALPSQGHAVELRMYRRGSEVQMDWWYDTRRLDRHTVEEFTEQFPLALIELTSEALPQFGGVTDLAMA